MILKRALFAACCLLATLGVAQTKYALQSRTINVGVVLLEADTTSYTGTPEMNNWTPFVWYNLDLDTAVKPSGWSFDNPTHESALVSSFSRWNVITGGTLPATGTRLSKNMAPYWEVQLENLTEAQIAQFNVLLISAHGYTEITPDEREKLHRFMDQGGIVWIDLDRATFTAGMDLFDTFPMPFTFSTATSVPSNFFANFLDPLLSFPFGITFSDLANMTGPNPFYNTGGSFAGITTLSTGNYSGELSSGGAAPLIADSFRMNSIFGTFGSPTNSVISTFQVGDGYEVVTTNDMATQLGNGQLNVFTAAIPTFTAYNNSAAKLVSNMVELSSQYGQQGKGSRKAGGSSADIGAPLMQEWNDTISYTSAVSYGYAPPVAYKNLVVVSAKDPATGLPTVFVYDAHPIESLSGSGNPDDGYQDFSQGTSYDLVFKGIEPASLSSTGVTFSAPTCVTVSNASGTSGTPVQPVLPDQIWVEDSNGNMLEWNAFGHFTDGLQAAEPADHFVDPGLPAYLPQLGAASFDTGVASAGPYAPTFQDGLLFVTDMTGPAPNVGRVWIVDPTTPDQPLMSESANNTTGTEVPWVCGGNGWKYNAETSGPSTVGNIPVYESPGASDRVVYVPMQPSSLNSTTAGFVSEWFGRKGESQVLTVVGGQATITPDCDGKNLTPYFPGAADMGNATLMSLAPRITLMGANGPANASDTEATISSIAPGSGTSSNALVITFNTSSSWYTANVTGTPPQVTVRIDYTVDWSNLGSPNPDFTRSSMNFPDDINRERRIVDNIALGPTGIMYMVVSTTNPSGDLTHPPGGSYYAIQEQGVGNFVVLDRYSLYDLHTETLSGVSPVATVPPTLENVDPLISLFSGLGNATNPSQLQDLTFTSGPVVSNGVVYVTAQGDNGFSPPVVDTILLAFNAQPPPVTINVSNVSAGFTLMQYDMDETQTRSAPTSPWVLPSTVYTFIPSPTTAISGGTTGSNTSNGVIYLSSLTSAGGGQQLAGCFSTSQPVVLRQVGSPDTLIYPDANGSHWSPLQWYTVFTGSGLPPGTSINTALGPPMVSGNTVYVPTSNPTLDLLYNSGSPFSYPGTPYGMVYGISTNISSTDPYLISDPAHPWQTQLAELNGGSSPVSVNNIVPNPDFLWPQLSGVTSTVQLATRLSQATLGPQWNFSEATAAQPKQASMALGVVGGNGRLFAWSDMGLYAFERANIYVADSNRVSSFDSDGNPMWSTDQTQNIGSTGYVGTVKKLVTPCRAYSTDNGQVLVVDPGSNRLAIVDQTGLELRSIEGFNVDPGFAPDGYSSGESTKLSAPRDVQVYTSVVPAANNSYTSPAPAGTEYWVHYLIADCGNGRLVDIVDRYTYDAVLDGPGDLVLNSSGVPVQGVLYWHTPTSYSGAGFSYTSLARAYDPTLTNGAGTGAYVIAAGVGNTSINNVLQTPPSAQVVNSSQVSPAKGGIIIFPMIAGVAPVQVSTIALPAFTGPLFVPTSELAGTWGATSPLTQRNIGAVNSLTAKYFTPIGQGTPSLSFLFTDQTGAYEIYAGTGATSLAGQAWTVDWMLPRSLPTLAGTSNSYLEVPVYSVMRQVGTSNTPTPDNPLDFVPTYAERLASGDILVVNGYSGRYRKATSSVDNVPFTGEVLELDPSYFNPANLNLGFTTNAIKAVLSTITGARNIVQPLFADRR